MTLGMIRSLLRSVPRTFPQNDKGYDLIVMEIDSNGNTVGDALAIVHVSPESISAGAFEAVIGVPGASLQIGKTYLVAAFDAAGDGNLQLNTVRFTVTQASSEGGGSSSGPSSKSEGKPVAASSASPSTASETANASGAKAPAAGSKSKTRGIQADTAMAPGTNDATISIPRLPAVVPLPSLPRLWGTALRRRSLFGLRPPILTYLRVLIRRRSLAVPRF